MLDLEPISRSDARDGVSFGPTTDQRESLSTGIFVSSLTSLFTDGSVCPMNRTAESTEEARPRDDRGADGAGRVLIVGARRSTRRLVHCLSKRPWSDSLVVGFVDARRNGRDASATLRGRQQAVHPLSDPVPILGGVDRLAELVARSGATDLLVAVPKRHAAYWLERELAHLPESKVRVHWIGDSAHDLGIVGDGRPRSSPPRPVSLVIARHAKRAVDIVGATIGLILLAPLFAVVAILIAVTTGRPIFYRQERVGQGGRLFGIIKFRSMRLNAESETGPIWASDHDERCTRVGGWLRRSNIDELPQLFNVLIGDMSLVGPRPERPIFVDGFREALPDYDLRHAVPVGMTGWAQVHGWRGRTSLRKRIQYDLDYIRRWSFWLDIRILFMTVQHVVWGKTTWGGGGLKRRPEC